MYKVAWNLKRGGWDVTRDGGRYWHSLAACNLSDSAEAVEEAARRCGVPPQLFIIM